MIDSSTTSVSSMTNFEDELLLEEGRSFQGLGSMSLARLMQMWPAVLLARNPSLNNQGKECTSDVVVPPFGRFFMSMAAFLSNSCFVSLDDYFFCIV